MVLLTISDKTNSVAQFLTVLLLFVLVIAVTWVTTHWIANYQKVQNTTGSNMKLIEASNLGNGKYIQLVQIGEKYFALAVCKDTVTLIGEIPGEQIKICEAAGGSAGFKDVFTKILENKNKTDSDEKQDS